MGKVIDIRRLVALDIALHGQIPITAEFIFGVFGIATIGILSLSGSLILGGYMILISLNYIPPLAYSLLIGSQKNAKKEARVEMSDLRRYGPKYGFQQLLIFVPFAILIVSVVQEFNRC
jgi:hypothetical protein